MSRENRCLITIHCIVYRLYRLAYMGSKGSIVNRLFSCSDHTWLSFVQVCDGIVNCQEGEDEKACQFSSAKMCTILSQLNSSLEIYICPSLPQNFMKKMPFDMCGDRTKFSPIYPQLSGKYLQSLKQYCIYEISDCGVISHDASGQHLMSCKDYKCNSTYFKCPRFYCVPWRYVCDGIWQCPGGMEEINCIKRSCIQQFRCKNSSICLHIRSTCDGQLDCPYNDDEVFCDTEFPDCPQQCRCSLYVCRFKTGKHLMTCEDFKCPDKYHKCPQYYCVRYKFLCDGTWDCPGGHDESKMLCTDRKCQGQFKCQCGSVG